MILDKQDGLPKYHLERRSEEVEVDCTKFNSELTAARGLNLLRVETEVKHDEKVE